MDGNDFDVFLKWKYAFFVSTCRFPITFIHFKTIICSCSYIFACNHSLFVCILNKHYIDVCRETICTIISLWIFLSDFFHYYFIILNEKYSPLPTIHLSYRQTPLQVVHVIGNFMRIWSIYSMYHYLSQQGDQVVVFLFSCLVPASIIFLVLQKPWKGRPLANSQVYHGSCLLFPKEI